MLLESLCHGNSKYEGQIYRGLIGHLTCTSAKAQQFVLHTLRNLQVRNLFNSNIHVAATADFVNHLIKFPQSKMEAAHHSIVEPLLSVLTSLHLEVQREGGQGTGWDPFGWLLNLTELCVFLAAARLIFDLRRYDLRPVLLSGLLTLLRPAKEEEQHEFQVPEGDI